MISIATTARISLLAISCLLLLPVVTIPLQDEVLLSTFHNRTLRSWPDPITAVSAPVEFFKNVKLAVSDRVNPIIMITGWRNKFLFFVLHTAPKKRVTIGLDGHLFLNGQGDDSQNVIFEAACVRAHAESMSERLKRSIPIISDYMDNLHTPVHFIANPTTPTLYPDFLPETVPVKYRNACAAPKNFGSPIARLSALNVIYPFAEMYKERDDPAYFPIVNFHPSGPSIRTVRNAYLRAIGRDTNLAGEQLLERHRPSEILSAFGIDTLYKRYALDNQYVSVDRKQSDLLSSKIAPFYAHPPSSRVLINSISTINKTALLLSDSYGGDFSFALASAFDRVIWVNAANMKSGGFPLVVEQVQRTWRIDNVILLFQEGGVDQINGWAEEITSAPKR